MRNENLAITEIDPSLYNPDIAPVSFRKRNWGWLEIFNVWTNCIQSLFGYTLAASLFITYGLNGWAVLVAIILAGVIIVFLVNLSGNPSVKYGIPFPVMVRASMGIRGAKFPALIRGIAGIFWYGSQTYLASTAVSLLLNSFLGAPDRATFLGMNTVGWISFMIVWALQMYLFWNGIEWIRTFLNWAAPSVYVIMIALMLVLWWKSGNRLLFELGNIFGGTGTYEGGSVAAFMTVVGTMVAYFAAVVLSYGDFSRFVPTQSDMRKGNLLGLPLNIAFFSLIALFVTAGTVVVFGERLTDPTQIVERVNNPPLTIVAALTFLVATIGINVVANFVPPANDLSNLSPGNISFRQGGVLAAVFGFVVGALWVSVISQLGIIRFVDTLGALLAPVYGIMIADYYLVKKEQLSVSQLFSADPKGSYYYSAGWNTKALLVFSVTAIFSIAAVWAPGLHFLSGFAWIIGALLGGALYTAMMRIHLAR